jgi:hypothetical protein
MLNRFIRRKVRRVARTEVAYNTDPQSVHRPMLT